MSFWNYLGLAALFDALFRRKSRQKTCQQSSCSRYNDVCGPDLDPRYDRLSDRIDKHREEPYDIEHERFILDEERFDIEEEYLDDYDDW